MWALYQETQKVYSATFIFEFTVERGITLVYEESTAYLFVNKIRCRKTFFHEPKVETIFLYKLVIVYIRTNHTVLNFRLPVLGVVDPASIVTNIRFVRQVNTKSSCCRGVFLPATARII